MVLPRKFPQEPTLTSIAAISWVASSALIVDSSQRSRYPRIILPVNLMIINSAAIYVAGLKLARFWESRLHRRGTFSGPVNAVQPMLEI